MLAARLQGRVVAWALPPFVDEKRLQELGEFGCDEVILLDHLLLSPWRSEIVAAAVAQAVAPECRAIFLPGAARGEEVAAQLAHHLGCGWVADVLTLAVTRSESLEVTSALSGGKVARLYRSLKGAPPMVLTLREGVAEVRRDGAARTVTVHRIAPSLDDLRTLTAIKRHLPADPRTQDIVHARKLVAGGRGTGGPEGMELVHRIAERLGASLAASRVAVDLGWAPPERQVGQTGRTVRPDLYIACGISGASHHLAGMRDSRHIISINADPTAPIHDIAHLSLRGDLHAILPALEKGLARRQEDLPA